VAGGLRLDAPGAAWLALAATLALGSVVAWWLPAVALDWQPALALNEPWRWWTAAFVHWSPRHLGANLIGAALVAALGAAARVPRSAALAWGLAWPLTHVGLLAQPALAHFGGLSGALHAGVAVAALHLLRCGHGRHRLVGGAVLAGLALKVLLEAPWGPALRHPPGWDIAVAPLAHATGLLAGAAATLLLAWAARRQSRR
jgi:rhomboid family GlyGly-CTERM serine protease